MPVQRDCPRNETQSGITVVILTMNEELNLVRCLDALHWADEIVVVDSGSSDQTCAVASQLGARVMINRPAKFVISEQRNWALDNAGISTPWVLFIDADEVVTHELAHRLCSVAQTPEDRYCAYRLAPKFIFMGKWLKHSLAFPVWHDRFLRLGHVRYVGDVWEYFKADSDVGYIREPYLHYGLSNGIRGWWQRHLRYSEWKAETLLSEQPLRSGGAKRLLHGLIEKYGAKSGPFSPGFRFFYYYFFRLGFLDGFPGFVYSLMIAGYQLMVYLFILEKRERMAGRSL